MADHTVDSLGGKTLLQYADTPYMDMLAKKGRCACRARYILVTWLSIRSRRE